MVYTNLHAEMLLEAVKITAADNRYVGSWDYSFSVMNSVL